jgi:DNA polymerase III subunit delta
MKSSLAQLLTEIANDQSPSVLLVFGDDLRVQTACDAVVRHLVPDDQRGFNFERFDGRSVNWDEIEASLMTPPFLPGKKVIWVENTPFFLSRDNNSELGEKVLQYWSAGKKDDAARLLLDLLTVEGWTAERWQQLDGSIDAVSELFEADDDDVISALVSHAKSMDLELVKRRGFEGHGLLELLERGLPTWDFLLLSALQVDRRTRIYRKFEELGAVMQLDLERERTGKVSRESLREFLDEEFKRCGKRIDSAAREAILIRAGDDLRALRQEIEKLLLYTVDQATIQVQDVEALFPDQADGWIFDLTRLLASGDDTGALAQLDRLMSQGEHPLKLLGALASEVRKLLCARQLMDGELRGRWRRGMNYNQFQQYVSSPTTTLLTRNPYADFMCFQRADSLSTEELLSYLRAIHDTDLCLKSTGNNPKLIMERLILRMCIRGHIAKVRYTPNEKLYRL